ncbi:MAG: DUF2254 domain-containing protein [Bradyrhizobium sp.]|uniref:DUF2254 domain-containing protein n=1 Tax=Bradyrhizobium sp. TaxID=376 RepID=UPI00299FBF5B|nr:DUF2254 domain-containing protein [Bradyrhizobium sp.]MDX3968036.1 DUF2254 domain-containing protein [Bradyrhizobium sp.]
MPNGFVDSASSLKSAPPKVPKTPAMLVRLRTLADRLAGSFWPIPGLLVALGIFGAYGLVQLDRSDLLPKTLLQHWVYDGGASGARSLLSAIASSTITVAGTVFSITIAALSLAAGQMGPRLLSNFTRDRGNQVTLGILLGTFGYALTALRSIRTETEGNFIPHVGLTVGIALAIACVGTMVYFIGHMASRINVDTVLELVTEDLDDAIERLTVDKSETEPPPAEFWQGARIVADTRRGYLERIDDEGLASWAAEHGCAIRLLVGIGDFVAPGSPIALAKPAPDGIEEAIRKRSVLTNERNSSSDLRFAVRQLVEVAVRALSPGINDPHTAISVVDRLGATLCSLSQRHLPTGVCDRDGRLALYVPRVQYDQLVNTMFHMIRQSAAGKPAVLIRLLKALTQVASCERDTARIHVLNHHAELVLADARRSVASPSDLEDIERRHFDFARVIKVGPEHYLADPRSVAGTMSG